MSSPISVVPFRHPIPDSEVVGRWGDDSPIWAGSAEDELDPEYEQLAEWFQDVEEPDDFDLED